MSRFLSEEGLKVFWKKIKDTFLEKKNNTIVQEMETVINDFNRWVRKETASLVKQDSNSFRGTVNAGVDQ